MRKYKHTANFKPLTVVKVEHKNPRIRVTLKDEQVFLFDSKTLVYVIGPSGTREWVTAKELRKGWEIVAYNSGQNYFSDSP